MTIPQQNEMPAWEHNVLTTMRDWAQQRARQAGLATILFGVGTAVCANALNTDITEAGTTAHEALQIATTGCGFLAVASTLACVAYHRSGRGYSNQLDQQ